MTKLLSMLRNILFVIFSVSVVLGFLIGGGRVLSMAVHFTHFEGTLIFTLTCMGLVAVMLFTHLSTTLKDLSVLNTFSDICEDDCLCSD